MDTYTQALNDSKKSLRDFQILNGQVKETLSSHYYARRQRGTRRIGSISELFTFKKRWMRPTGN